MSAPDGSREPAVGGPTSAVETACPLDCPDACSLTVTVRRGRVIEIDGSHKNPVTDGFICAKVRKFGDRLYGPDRLLYPAIRQAARAREVQAGCLGRRARADRRSHEARKGDSGGASILPYSYGGSNGLLTQDNFDAKLWRRFGTSRLARTVCAAPTGAANMALYGKMASVTYQDYPEAALIILWGVNPSTSGIHLVPYVREAQKRGAKLVVVDPRSTPLARSADVHLPVKPGTDVAVALAIHRYLFANGYAAEAFLHEHARGVEQLRERAEEWTIGNAASVAGVEPPRSSAWRNCTRRTRRRWCGVDGVLERTATAATPRWRCSRYRQSAESSAVRGGGYSMSNSASWNIDRPGSMRRARHPSRQHEPSRAGAHRVCRPAGQGCCSSTTAIPRRRCPIRSGSFAASSAKTCSRSCSTR
jgi:hypothetical protein